MCTARYVTYDKEVQLCEEKLVKRQRPSKEQCKVSIVTMTVTHGDLFE